MRREPRLLVDLPLEGVPRVLIVAESFEDELRLRSWLRRSGRLDQLAAIVVFLLDDLDRVERINGEEAA